MILLVAGRVQRIFNLGVDETMQKKSRGKTWKNCTCWDPWPRCRGDSEPHLMMASSLAESTFQAKSPWHDAKNTKTCKLQEKLQLDV